MGIKVTSIEYCTPKKIENLSNLKDDFHPWKKKEIFEKTGVKNRHIALPTETSLDLSIKASLKILKKHDRKSIDGVIFCTQTPDFIIPSNSFLIQSKLKLKKDIFNFDFNHACSGYIYSLVFADSLIKNGIGKKFLLINADTYSKYIKKEDRSTRALFGDAAAVCLIESTKKNVGIIDYNFYADGDGYKSFWIPW